LLVGYTDWYLAGHFLPGEAPKAAMGLMAYVLWILPTLFSLISIGRMALVARFVGAGRRKEASHVVNQALLLGIVAAGIGIFFFLIGDSGLFPRCSSGRRRVGWRCVISAS